MGDAARIRSEKVSFPGSQGEALAARLDLPDGPVRAYALFAHCFTCTKDVFAAARVSHGLAEHGYAVLRFDFTGLGQSGGDFANTNFSSNVQDLIAAADFLRETYEAPSILVGHSLGGAAVLSAAADVPEAKAVATIGAPADAAHVAANFSGALGEIEEKGEAEVTLVGRPFTIRKQFLDDIEEQRLEERIKAMKKALIVFHSPVDQQVGIDNASRIFLAAKHPKSFVSLDNADHLLSRRTDAIYVADVLSAWARRYLPEHEPEATVARPDLGEGEMLVAETREGKFQQEIDVGNHHLTGDEPVSVGGLDSGPSPYDYLMAALGTCTSMTMRMYADRKRIPASRFAVRLRHDKVHAEDCADCETQGGMVDEFVREISIEGDLDEATRQKLMEIADKCPVHRTLTSEVKIRTRLVDG